MRPIRTIKCTHVDAQVGLGYYDAEGNLIGEEYFPQSQGGLIAARLFHPHAEQLASLIETCVEQAWAKLSAQAAAEAGQSGSEGSADSLAGGGLGDSRAGVEAELP